MNIKSELRPLILIALVAFVVFANSLGGDFVYDDVRQILRNPLIQDSSLYGKALTSDVWAFKGDGSVAASNYFRPTFVAWLILNFKLFGINAFGWHLFNVLLHIGVCLLGYLLLRRWQISQNLSFAIALVFAVHPVHTESVAWISGSPDLLFSIFLLGSFWFAESDAESRRQADEKIKGFVPLNLIVALIFYAFALGSKEVAIICFPLFYLIFANRNDTEKPLISASQILRTMPFAALSVLFFAARYIVLGAISLPPGDAHAGLKETILTAPSAFVFYLKQMLFPVWLGANYSLRPVSDANALEFLLPLLISLLAIALFFLLARRSFVQKFGFALFILTLAPAMNIGAFPIEQIVHDRYLYLPVFGFLMMISPHLSALLERITKKDLAFAGFAILISFPLAAKTFFYNQVWKNELALWSHAVTIDKNSAFNWSQYGATLSENGKTEEAVEAYNNAIDIRPTALAFYGKARNLVAQKRYEEAIHNAKTVIEMPPETTNAYLLYQTYELLSLILSDQKQFGEAQKVLFEARRRLPIYSAALTEKLAVVMYQSGEKTSALRELEAARNQARAELLPESKSVFLRLGMLYAEMGRKDEAKAVLQEYLKLTANLKDIVTVNDRRQAAALLGQLN